MLRSCFFTLGLFVALWGGAFMAIDSVQFKSGGEHRDKEFRGMLTRDNHKKPEDALSFNPPQWLSFTLLTVGAVTMLYAVALPRSRKD